jgi:hypothetical protein
VSFEDVERQEETKSEIPAVVRSNLLNFEQILDTRLQDHDV